MFSLLGPSVLRSNLVVIQGSPQLERQVSVFVPIFYRDGVVDASRFLFLLTASTVQPFSHFFALLFEIRSLQNIANAASKLKRCAEVSDSQLLGSHVRSLALYVCVPLYTSTNFSIFVQCSTVYYI